MNKSKTPVASLWFLSHGCRQVPLEHSRNHIRWGHPDGYFLNEKGQKLAHNISPAYLGNCHNHPAPIMRDSSKHCHILMAMAFYGERPVFTDSKGKSYVGICHHLVPDLLNYRPANLLCWLTRSEHNIADRRQRAIQAVLPNGNLYLLPYEYLRYLQDPRTLSDEEFNQQLAYLSERKK